MAKERRKGDKLAGIPTDEWNEFVWAAKQVREWQKIGNTPGQSDGEAVLEADVFNTTGEDIEADRPILKISRPVYTPEDRESVIEEGIDFDGTTPDEDTRIDQIAILQGPVRDESPRSAVIMGHTYCDVLFTDLDHTHAKIIPDDNTQLESGTTGLPIVWHEDIEPDYLPATIRACVRLGGGGSSSSDLIAHAYLTTEDIAAAPATTDGGVITVEGQKGMGHTWEQEIDGETITRTENEGEVLLVNFSATGYLAGVLVYAVPGSGTLEHGGQSRAWYEIITGDCAPYDPVDEGS
jgi:hypothetical protein